MTQHLIEHIVQPNIKVIKHYQENPLLPYIQFVQQSNKKKL